MNFVEYYDETSFQTNYASNLKKYFQNCKHSSIYQFKNFKTKRNYLNFINQENDNLFDRSSKKIIEKELLRLESISSGLGDLFLEKIIEYNKKRDLSSIFEIWENSVENFNLSHISEFIEKNIQDTESKYLCEEILKNSPAGSSYFVQDTNMKDNFLKISQKIFFDIKFDTEMLCGKKWSRSEANIILIDGYIDSLGEIHHLLHNASENKEPYLIICKGLRDDVKSTVIHNVMRGTIDVTVISLETNEENVNILNDIAACIGSDIVSSQKGDTISNSIKKELSVVKSVVVKDTGVSFNIADNKSMSVQKSFLVNRKNKLSENDPNFKYLTKRIKNLSNKRVDFYFRNGIDRETKIEIDYFLKFLINGKTGIVRNKKGSKIYTLKDLYIFKNVFVSTVKTIENIGGCLMSEMPE